MSTISGCRSSLIVSRPSGAWAIVPRKTSAASHVAQPGSPRVRGAVTQAARLSVIGKSAKARFPNSITEWCPAAGKNAPSWQPGQDWQASPEPVRRTAAPVRTIR